MYEQISQAITTPHQLEALYRQNPEEFRVQFLKVFAEHPDSVVLQVWHERLFFREDLTSQKEISPWIWKRKDILLLVILSFLAGTLLKLPHWITAIDEEFFYSRNLSFIIALALMAYFLIRNTCPAKLRWSILLIVLGGLIYINLLPDVKNSQTILLSCLHMPILLWSLLGLAFTGEQWRSTAGRWDYLRYNGEMLIYSTIIFLGGIVLTGLTILLFDLIQMDIEDWYVEYIGIYGAAAIPLVATFIIERVTGSRFRIAPILSKLFTPLFLVTVIVYLVTMILAQKSPYTDRNFLMIFNALLFVVLGLTVFSISERQSATGLVFSDYLTFALIAITLVLDLIALSAIVFRLSSYGFTPNRMAVLGANVCIFGHLAGIVYHHICFMRQREEFAQLVTWVTNYIPVYTIWSAVVILGFPLFFRFTHLNP